MRFISLRIKMLAGILLPTMLVLVITGLLITSSVSKSTQQLTVDKLASDATAVSEQLNHFFTKYITKAESVAADYNVEKALLETPPGIAFVDMPWFSDINQTLIKQQQTDPDIILGVYIGDADSSQIMISDGFLSGINWGLEDRPYFEAVVSSRKTYLTTPYTDANTGGTVITIASPVFNSTNNEVIGISAIDITLENLSNIISSYSIGQSGFSILTDAAGNILYHPDSSYINQSIAQTNLSEDIKSAVSSSAFGNYTFFIDDVKYYGTLSKIGDTGFSVLSCMPEAEAMASYSSTISHMRITFIICLVIVAICIILLSEMIIKPLLRLRDTAQSIAEGNLDVAQLSHSSDEIGQVSIALSHTVEQLKKYILYIDEIASVLNQISHGNLVFTLQNDYTGEFAKIETSLLQIRTNLVSTLTTISNSSDKVLETSVQLTNNAQSLAEGATEQASSVEELSASLADVSHHIEQSAKRVESANQQANAIGENIALSDRKMKEMLNSIQHINDFSAQIEAIIKTIEDIAFQTNILALNAAVEAARAGAAGKGFAVVADEVRNLAAKSAEAAKNTAELITQTVQAISKSTEIAQQTTSAMNCVVEGSQSIIQELNKISKMSVEQSDTLSQISTGIEQISSVVQTNSASAQESSASIHDLSVQVKFMEEEIDKFKLC